MPYPSAPSSVPDHEQHDQLLVAQLAAGDPLDEAQRMQAQRLVSSCAACAQLAADLRSVARAVASEPVPSRRRDFRLDPEQAERLRGNPLTRFLRRLSLPQAHAFRPAAAGIMTVGLAFVVAGYAWPGSDGLSVEGTIPASVELQAATAPPAEQPAPLIEDVDVPQAAAQEPGSMVEETREADAFFDDAAGLEAFGDEATSPDETRNERLQQRADEGSAVEAESDADPESFALGAAEDVDTSAKAGAADAFVTEDATVTDDALDEAGSLDGAAASEAFRAAPPDVTANGRLDGGQGAMTTTAAGSDPEPVVPLVILGVVLALGGGGALIVGWLVRRARDPLLR